ncbi:hypothetical protein AB205_0202450 [Aquarana catesbeiana]|uniref:Proteasome adapter and scaffold protein ECM29 HEAT-repeat domain-containing protein n=1 Tax=Aquarana catesbeiana TaxID=8400 RepID=A0A2G9RQM0_AQUCT|nr:hypothetical protein AB205_0202450 [Aquarana catesbeiana]
MCESSKGIAGQKTIAVLLPCLLDKGIMSTVTEVRALSINTLVKISKSAGELLKPHTPKLIPALLESLSVLEPQVLNYLSLRATDQEKAAMDSARLNAAKSSPMMETINMCIQHLDVPVLAELVPRLCELIKSGLGLGTKGGCASVVVSLTTQCPQDLMPYSGKLMSALLSGLSDRNSVVQKSYAFALGHLVRTTRDTSTEKLLQKLSAWYMEKEEPVYRSGCTLTIHAISRYSPDVLKNHSGSISGGIRLYMKELIDITQKALQSPSWKMKAQGAAAMASIAKQQTGSLVPPHLGMVLDTLLQGLPGRTWAGKEELLKAIGTVVSSCSKQLKEGAHEQPTIDDIIQAVLKECRKENVKYKIVALKCAADTSLETVGAQSPKEEDDPDEKAKELQTEFLLCAFSTLGKAWPRNPATQCCYRFEVCKLMCERLKLSTWKVQHVVLQSMTAYFQGLLILEKEHSDIVALTEILSEACPAIAHSLENKSYSSIRTEALSILELLIKKLEDSKQWESLTVESRHLLIISLSTMEQDSRPDLKDKGLLLKKRLESLN